MKTKLNTVKYLLASLLLAGLGAGTATACDKSNTREVRGSQALATQSRTVGDFSKIKLSGSPDLTITVGPATSVQVTAEEDLLPLIATDTEGDTLKIRPAKSFRSHQGIKIEITTPALDAVSINGSGDVRATGIKSDDFVIGINGSGDARLNGTAGRLTVSISGSGDVKADELKAVDAKVRIHGSGDALVHASGSLDAAVNGSGDIQCLGRPEQVKKKTHGSGDITVR